MIGTTCRLGVDRWEGGTPLDEVEGDFLRTAAGSCYQIVEVRKARPGSKRLATLVCIRLGKDAVGFGEPGVHRWEWTRRG